MPLKRTVVHKGRHSPMGRNLPDRDKIIRSRQKLVKIQRRYGQSTRSVTATPTRRAKHSPAGSRHIVRSRPKTIGKGRGKVRVSANYYGGANRRRKTADELLKEVKGR